MLRLGTQKDVVSRWRRRAVLRSGFLAALGLAVTETRFTKLNERANALIQALINRIPGHG